MAVIHNTTTLTPTKLELLATWLPAQPWYRGKAGQQPELARTGGFRLDDPEGEVGIEFMVATDTSGDQPVSYQIPFSYRGAPIPGADEALIGTAEHGVLGQRWVYDGTRDPVLVAQLFALIVGEAEPQMQSTSNTPDPSVTGWFAETGIKAALASTTVTDAPDGTDLLVETAPDGRRLAIHINRVLQPGQDTYEQALGHVTADVPLPGGTKARTAFAVVHAHP
ncbi:1,4-alpha-glucan branching protein [Streptomyces sp. NBC_01108]|uniref:maltokinase N-terminal cap-like domain-containing protein n=1 Tax=Streptomyces sp. NBC_01108 TaxID=2903751 RepID=UPI003872AC0C|nr:1,4-alpha-glucan branching protein [Streptomyces sp. NBC_01108]